MSKHTLSVLVEDKPGVLTRVAALFSRRGFNIDSLAVGPTELPDISRITVVVDVEDAAARAGDQAAQQAHRGAQGRRARRRTRRSSARSCSSRCAPTRRPAASVLETVQLFRAKVVDVATDALVIEATGNSDKLQALLDVLEPFGIKELVQSGHRRRRPRLAVDHRPEPAQRLSRPGPTRSARPTVPPRPPHTATEGEGHHGRDVLRRRRRPVASSRARRSPSSATAARATPTRSTCATPASTSASASPRAASPRPRRRPRA